MSNERHTVITHLLRDRAPEILTAWVQSLGRDLSVRTSLLKPGELDEQARAFLNVLQTALATSSDSDVLTSEAWAPVRDFLSSISRSRARQGFTPTETATFVFSLKRTLFTALQKEQGSDSSQRADAMFEASLLLDQLGLFTSETYQKGREEVISRQQQELMELSTPVVQLWDGILALPLIGTLDSARTQVVMESLLQAIVDTGSAIAIIDITGVPFVDTLVAQHLLKTIAAARLMGADCIISGIRPQIAQTIVHLGVELNDVITKATLADAFRIALTRIGMQVAKIARTARPVAAASGE
jgi:rsbT co-antagonist protein RsbR